MTTEGPVGTGYPRRVFLGRAGAAFAASSGLGAVLAACGGSKDNAAKDDPNYGTSKHPLVFHHDAAVGPLFAPYVTEFNQSYKPLQLKTSYVANDYFTVTPQQLAGGNADYDVLFADEGYLDAWYKNGWIKPVDGMSGLDKLVANFNDGIEPLVKGPDGKIVALPYFRGAEIFVYNKAHLDKINAKPPATWDEFLSTARELKSKGVVDTPYSPYWISYAFLIWHQLAAEAASDGAAPFFDDAGKPAFASDPVVEKTLQRWQTMYKEGLVPKDVLTTDYGGVTNIFGGGKSSMSLRYQAQVVGWKDPKQSRVAADVTNALIPGSSRTTHSFGAYWFMSDTTGSPNKAWELMEYLGGPGKDGSYTVPKKLVAIGLGLSSGYKSIDSDPEVIKSWGKWADTDALTQQLKQAVSLGPTVNKSWYPKFLDNVTSTLQQIVQGKKGVTDGLKEVGDFVNSQAS
jgi:multiple sugar transport system substrate-binding protein